MSYNSLITCDTTPGPTDDERRKFLIDRRDELFKQLEELKNSLNYTKIKDKYDIWREYFWEGDYEDYSPSLEFPEFLDEYEKLVKSKIIEYKREYQGSIKYLNDYLNENK